MKYTLITGASQGMGLLMAKKCATLKRNVLLISLPNENLSNIAIEISNEFQVSCHYFEIDLTLNDSAKKIFNWVKKNNFLVDFLIKLHNNHDYVLNHSRYSSNEPEYPHKSFF